MPPFFQKTNKLGVQKNILFVQGIAVTVLSLLFVVMPSVQSFYQILSQLTVILYLIMYLLMFSGAIALRYKMKKLNRPFRIGKSGNGLMWFIGGLGFCGSLLAFILSFIPPSQISTGSNTVWFSVLIIGAIIVVVAPFIIYAAKKPSWKDPDTDFEPFHWEVQPQTVTAGVTCQQCKCRSSGFCFNIVCKSGQFRYCQASKYPNFRSGKCRLYHLRFCSGKQSGFFRWKYHCKQRIA